MISVCKYSFALVALLASQNFVYAAETAKILPKGIFRVRLVTIDVASMSESLNNEGQSVALGAPLSRKVTTADLAQKDLRVRKLQDTLNSIQKGLGSQLMSASLASDISMKATSMMPALEYGVSEKLSLGIRIPVIRRNVDVNINAQYSNNGKALAQKMAGAVPPELTDALNQFSAMSFDRKFFIQSLFTAKGYDTPASFEKTEIGDLEFGGKYNFYKKNDLYNTFQLGFRAPTGSTPSVTNIFDKGSGGGAWATCGSLYQEYFPTKHLGFGGMQKATYYIPDTRQRAVPKDENDDLPSLLPADGQVKSVTRRQAVKLEGELSATLYFMESSLSFWSAYQFAAKNKDRYSGTGDLDYDKLADNSNQISHAAELGAGYSTVNAYKRKQFSIPGEVQVLYNTVLSGKNVMPMDYVRMDMIAYF